MFLFCSVSAATEFTKFVDLQSNWLAKIEKDLAILKILIPSQVLDKCREGGCIIFYGIKNSFKPKLSLSTIALYIFLPRYNQGQ